jgi:hypothetical protein
VRAFAYPYGATVPALVPLLAEAGYGAACTTRIGIVGPSVSPFALPRVDVHYIRAPRRFESALEGSSTVYLGARGAAARARRLLLSDYR